MHSASGISWFFTRRASRSNTHNILQVWGLDIESTIIELAIVLPT